ncbi:hypothetical protein [Flavobacterium sp.]|uniref:hypothetical protein n=1 Tax=Flavobacterium sp. TaxID=239 RepID=UPI002ED82CCA
MAKQTFKTPLNFQQVNVGSLEDKVLMRTAGGDIKELPSDSFGSAGGEFTLTGQGVTSTGANSANMQVHNVFGSGAYLKSSGNNTTPATAGYLSEDTNVVYSARPVTIDSQKAGIMGLKFNKSDFSPNIEKSFMGNADTIASSVKPAVLTTVSAVWMLSFFKWSESECRVGIYEKQEISRGGMIWTVPTGGMQGIPVLYNTSIGLIFYKDSSVINKIASFRNSFGSGLTPYPDLAIPDGLFATHAFLGADNNVYFGATNSDYSINRIYKLLATNDTISLVIDLGASPVLGQPLIGNLFTSAFRLYMFSDHEGHTKRITYAGVGTPFNSPVPLGREFVNYGTVYALAKDEVNNPGIYVLAITSGDATAINLTGVPSANSNWRSLGISAIGFDGNSLLICPKTTGTTPQYGIHKFTNAYAFEGEIKQEYGNTLMFWNDNYHGCVGSVGANSYIRYYPKFGGNLLAFDKDGNVIKNTEDVSQYWVQRNDIMYLKPAQYAYDFFLTMDTNSRIYKVPAIEYNRAVIVQTNSYTVPTTQNSMSFVFNTAANCSVTFDNTPFFFRGRRMTFINRMTGNVTISRTNAIDVNGTVGNSAIIPPNRTGVLECIGNIFYFSLLATS